jgi:hypothetical protein
MRAGVLAEFDSAGGLLRAHDALRSLGYSRLCSWTPYPVRGLFRDRSDSIVPWLMLGGALVGGGLGYWVQWLLNARIYPIDVGGRPLNSAPAFIPITFESAVLLSALTGFFAMLGINGLPRLHHRLFEVDGFERASIDRFWLGVDEADPRFEERVVDDLERAGAVRCQRVGREK